MVEFALPRALHTLGQRAISEARLRRATSVEAEHLLLAILADRSNEATTRLEALGLTYDGFTAALDAERTRSLGAAGIATVTSDERVASPRGTPPGWGASIRDVLRNADRSSATDGRPGALELALSIAILGAQLGTVSRALSIATLDRLSIRSALDQDSRL